MKIYDPRQPHIYSGEIWQKSQCLDHEDAAYRAIKQVLIQSGFHEIGPRSWTNQPKNRRVVLCLVDDIISAGKDYHVDLPYLFDRDTLVITDNHINCPTVYKQQILPRSFMGIYHYQPSDTLWQPDRDFSFSVNRIDYRRTLLMLELAWRVYLDRGYVNFNCQKRTNDQLEEHAATFHEIWERDISAELKVKYAKSHELIAPLMPVRNYDIGHDTIHNRSWVNIVVESYSSDNNISVSEKIFRALVTPAPWTVYAGRYTVAWLESLGFDCMSDVINHNHYDRLKEVEDKIHVFVWFSLKIIKELKNQAWDQLSTRCRRAAEHNRALLSRYHARWPTDFKAWLEHLPSQLAVSTNLG